MMDVDVDELQTLDIGVDRSILGDQSLNSLSPAGENLVFKHVNVFPVLQLFSSHCFGRHMTRLRSDYIEKTH